MKITIEPTEKIQFNIHNTVTIETPSDELTVPEVVEVIARAMNSYGFSYNGVKEFLESCYD